MKSPNQNKNRTQLVWGLALLLVGIAVFFRIPQVMPRLAQMGQSEATIQFVRIFFYLLGAMLIGGGAHKIIRFLKPDI